VGIELQLNLDRKVTSFLSDENFAAIVGSFLFVFSVLGAQVIVQIDPGLDDLTAMSALHGDPEGTILEGACEETGEFFYEFHGSCCSSLFDDLIPGCLLIQENLHYHITFLKAFSPGVSSLFLKDRYVKGNS